MIISNVIKNIILVTLIILIIHFIIKNVLIDSQKIEKYETVCNKSNICKPKSDDNQLPLINTCDVNIQKIPNQKITNDDIKEDYEGDMTGGYSYDNLTAFDDYEREYANA